MRLLQISALAVLATSLASFAKAQEPKWEAIKPEGAGVEVKFPGHPEAKDSTEGNVRLKLYTLFPKPGQAFVFAWTQYPTPFTAKTAEAELQSDVTNFCKSANQTLQSQTFLSHQDPYVIEAIANGDGFKSWGRYYVHGSFVYGLVTLFNANDKASPVPFDDMITFLHSIKILPEGS